MIKKRMRKAIRYPFEKDFPWDFGDEKNCYIEVGE
jgi:hypothetical protein